MLSPDDVRRLVTDRVTTRTPQPGSVLVTTPFLNSMGDPIEIEVATTEDGYRLTDAGAVAGLLFSSATHHQSSPQHRLLVKLASVYGLSLDYEEGLVIKHTDPQHLQEDIGYLATAVTAMLAAAPLL